MNTVNELLDELVSDISDECHDTCGVFNRKEEIGGSPAPAYLASPRTQLRKWLDNTASYIDDGWHGPAAITALLRMTQAAGSTPVLEQMIREANEDGHCRIRNENEAYACVLTFLIIRRLFPMLAAGEFGSIQPLPSIYGQQFFLDAFRVGGTHDTAAMTQLRLCSVTATATRQASYSLLMESIDALKTKDALGQLDAGMEIVGQLGRELALEFNAALLAEMAEHSAGTRLEFGTKPPVGKTEELWRGYIGKYIDHLSNQLFMRRFGDITHVVAGPSAHVHLAAIFAPTMKAPAGSADNYAGLTLCPFSVGYMPNLKVFKCALWARTNPDLIVGLRRGQDWSDTPLVFSPFVTTVSSREGKSSFIHQGCQRIVVPSALASLVVNENAIGVELN